jgi:hypothetical protein
MWPAKILKNLGSLHAKHWWIAHFEEHYAQGVHLIELARQSILSVLTLRKPAPHDWFTHSVCHSTESNEAWWQWH